MDAHIINQRSYNPFGLNVEELRNKQAEIEKVFEAIQAPGWKMMLQMFQEIKQKELSVINVDSGKDEEKTEHVERVYLASLEQLEAAYIHFGEDFDFTSMDSAKSLYEFHVQALKARCAGDSILEHVIDMNTKSLMEELDGLSK